MKKIIPITKVARKNNNIVIFYIKNINIQVNKVRNISYKVVCKFIRLLSEFEKEYPG